MGRIFWLQPLVPSTAFADAWIQVDRTENPRFFVNLLDATRARFLNALARRQEFLRSACSPPRLNDLTLAAVQGTFFALAAPFFPGTAVGVDLSETMIAEHANVLAENPTTSRSGWERPGTSVPGCEF